MHSLYDVILIYLWKYTCIYEGLHFYQNVLQAPSESSDFVWMVPKVSCKDVCE